MWNYWSMRQLKRWLSLNNMNTTKRRMDTSHGETMHCSHCCRPQASETDVGGGITHGTVEPTEIERIILLHFISWIMHRFWYCLLYWDQITSLLESRVNNLSIFFVVAHCHWAILSMPYCKWHNPGKCRYIGLVPNYTKIQQSESKSLVTNGLYCGLSEQSIYSQAPL